MRGVGGRSDRWVGVPVRRSRPGRGWGSGPDRSACRRWRGRPRAGWCAARAGPASRGWVRVPAAFVGARWQPGRAAVVGVVIVVVLAAAVFGLRVAWARSSERHRHRARRWVARRADRCVGRGRPGRGERGGRAIGGRGLGGASRPRRPLPGGASPRLGWWWSTSWVACGGPGCARCPQGRGWPMRSRRRWGDLEGRPVRLNLARVLVDGEQVRVPARRPGRAGAVVPGRRWRGHWRQGG